MENNAKKVKNIEVAVIIILSILLIGVLVFLGIRYISKQNMSIINNAISNLDDIYNEANKNNEEENKNDEIEKVKYSKVSDLIEDLVHEKNPIEKKAYENVIYKLDMVLPYFKIQTEVTKLINEEIYKTYKFNTEDYLSKESTQSSSRNKTISYTADMDTEKGILTLEITNVYTDWAGTGAPNGSSITTYKYDYINDKLIEKKEQEKVEEEKLDPYANYKDYKWGTTKVGDKNDFYAEIKNNEVYVTYSNKTTQVKNISGTPKKIVQIVYGGMLRFCVLTQEGKIYTIDDWETTANLLVNLSKYNVIDMTAGGGKGVVYRSMYYLTSDGKLIDQNGDTFEALNKNFVTSYGRPSHNVYIDNKLNVYYSKKGDANYITVKDTSGNKVKAKELYIQDTADGETIIIITKDSQIIYVSNEGNITQEKGKFKSINTYSQEYEGVMLITMSNNKNIIKYGLDYYYYDVEKKKTIDIKEGLHIESIRVNKRNEKYTDKYYPATMTLTEEQIKSVIELLKNINYVSDKVTTQDKDIYRAIIKYKNGIEAELKVLPGMRVIMDGSLYSVEDLSIEVFSTIGHKFDWEKTNSENAVSQLKEISSALQQQILLSYDGKVKTSSDVVSACKLYENTDNILIRIIVDEEKQYQLGKYGVKISDSVMSTLAKQIEGGVNVLPGDNGKYPEIKTNTSSEVEKGIATTETYYSYVMKDTSTQKIIGILFVRKGAIK